MSQTLTLKLRQVVLENFKKNQRKIKATAHQLPHTITNSRHSLKEKASRFLELSICISFDTSYFDLGPH